MGQIQIIDYSDEWRSKLRDYLKKTFLSYSEAYIEYSLDHSTDRVPSKIVINSGGEIVGCHLYYCTKAIIKGEEIETQWGHDTYLNKDYRSSFGLDFMLYIHSIKGFGVGLSGINKKIQTKRHCRAK